MSSQVVAKREYGEGVGTFPPHTLTKGGSSMNFIDQELIKKANKAPVFVRQIDFAWRRYNQKIKENIFKLPFPGNYNARVIKNISNSNTNGIGWHSTENKFSANICASRYI